MAYGVNLHLVLAHRGFEDRLDFAAHLRVALVHQTANRAVHQSDARDENVQRNDNRKERIEGQPAGKLRQEQRDDDAQARPAIGENVLAVRFQYERTVFLPKLDEVPSQPCVDERRRGNERNPLVEPFEVQTRNPFHDRFIDDEERCEQDHRAFEARGEKADAVVPVRMLLVRRFDTERETVCRETDCENVDDGLRGVRENRGGIRQQVRADLQHEHHHSDGKRKPHGNTHAADLLR